MGLETLDQSLALVDDNGERIHEAELYGLRGEEGAYIYDRLSIMPRQAIASQRTAMLWMIRLQRPRSNFWLTHKTVMGWLMVSACMLLLAPAANAKRLALVVGNSDYATGRVETATNAANTVASRFRALGFDVNQQSNLDAAAMRRALLTMLNTAKSGDTLVMYFAGRVDTGALLGTGGAQPAGFSVQDLLRALGRRPPGSTLLLIDHAPSAGGLSAPSVSGGARVVLAAQPGTRAIYQDGKSVFASALDTALSQSSNDAEAMLSKLAAQVAFVTGRKQKPWLAGPPLTASALAATSPGTATSSAAPVRMRAVKGGCFEMGSGWGEDGRQSDESAHEVCIGDFKLAQTELTVSAFRAFVSATGYQTEAERNISTAGCWGERNGNWGDHAGASWKAPGYAQTDAHPVVCVSWNDANAYIRWLNQSTGKRFRLPTEAEWEYAARAGTSAARFWGDDPNAACRYANVADEAANRHYGGWTIHGCDDGAAHTAPAGKYVANSLGLKDLIGSVWEWTCSAYDASYDGGEHQCANSAGVFAMRGGGWDALPKFARSAARHKNPPVYRSALVGFRLAED